MQTPHKLATLFLGCLIATAACKREEPAPPHPTGAQRVVESAAPTTAASLRLAPAGPLVRARRGFAFTVYGKEPLPPAALERVKQRVRTVVPDLRLLDDATRTPPGVSVSARDLAKPPLPVETLAEQARGLTSEQVQAAAASKSALELNWFLAEDSKLATLRKATALAAELAEQHHGFVWDNETDELFTVAEWKKRRTQGWEGEIPDAANHFSVRHYQVDGGRHRAVTIGMLKLGLPDLVIQDAPPGQIRGLGNVINVTAQLMVEGAKVAADGKLAVDLNAIRHTAVRQRLLSSVLGATPRRASVELRIAPREKEDRENNLLEMRFPDHPGQTEVERASAAADALFGGSEAVEQRAPSDPELLAIEKRVQARLPVVAAAVRAGLPAGDAVSVKAPFDTDDGGVEWMWISVTSWEGETIRGTLDNQPVGIAALRLGARVEARQSRIADYLWKKANGAQEGGESIAVHERRRGGH